MIHFGRRRKLKFKPRRSQHQISAGLTSYRGIVEEGKLAGPCSKTKLQLRHTVSLWHRKFPNRPTPRAAPAKINCSASPATPSAAAAAPTSALRPQLRGSAHIPLPGKEPERDRKSVV